MYLSEYAEGQRLLRITSRARTDRQARPRYSSGGNVADGCGSLVEDERRATERIATNCEVVVRRIGTLAFSVQLGNVSSKGCQIEIVDGYTDGDDLIARFPRLEPLAARVRWTKEGRAGLEFTKSIHTAVLAAVLGRMELAATA